MPIPKKVVVNPQRNALVTPARQLKVGDLAIHSDGRTVKIVNGAYELNGRVSNYWHWREVRPDGSLSTRVESGYWPL